MSTELKNEIEIRGRIRKPTVQLMPFKGGVTIRIDSDVDPSFWTEVSLSAEVLADLLRQANTPMPVDDDE